MTAPTNARDPPALPAALMAAWLEQSHDLLVLTDARSVITWCNPAFTRRLSTAGTPPANLLIAAPESQARARIESALSGVALADAPLCLNDGDGQPLWVEARVVRVAEQWLWTFKDITAARELAERAQHQAELLDTAQEFGRIGIWEREIPSGKGRWDRHVFGFWGMEPADVAPDLATTMRHIHPDDQSESLYFDSTLKAGRYAKRYRIVQQDGRIRWIHSQWEIKNSPSGEPNRTIGIMVDDTESYELARSLDSAARELRLAVEMCDIIIWHHDLRTGRLKYNDRGYAVLGIPYSAEGLSLDDIRSNMHPDDVPRMVASAELAIASGQPVDVQTRYRRADGAWRQLLTRRSVERSADGEVTGFVAVSLDITDQVNATRRAEGLALRLETAARVARIGVWMASDGIEDNEWNDQMYELFDMVGEPRPPSLRDWLVRCVHPDDAPRVLDDAKAYLRARDGVLDIEFRTRRRDGSTRWIVLRANTERSATGATQVFGIALDVTDKHASLDALHAVSARAALIARSAGIGTWETIDDGQTARWDEQMFRLRGIEPRSTPLNREERLAMVHPDDRSLVLDATDGDIGEQPSAYEFRLRMPDGSYRWIASRSTELRDAQGTVLRRVGVNWDVTESKDAEQARQQAALAVRESQAKSQFLSRMSHELRTPLNAVLGFTQLLQLEASQNGAHAQLGKLGHIRAAGEHLLTLINDVLDLSSLEAGTLKLDLQPVALAATVREALPLVQDLAQRQGVVLRIAALAGTAQADPTRLRQVLLNLLTNAIKYNRPGGEVTLGSRMDGDRVVLSVRDTGRGMRPQQLAHLFEPFNRLGIDGEGIDGSGIGLTIVKALTEGMGGSVAVSSVPGQGSVFEIALPGRAAAAVQPAPEADSGERELRFERAGQLLYIEDNQVNVLLVEELVRGLSGLSIASEATGAAGVERALTLRPDVILIDMQLPDFDGFEVLRRLRLAPETASTPCIALSANAMPDDIERARAAGFDDYWTKPIKFKEFLRALEQLFPLP